MNGTYFIQAIAIDKYEDCYEKFLKVSGQRRFASTSFGRFAKLDVNVHHRLALSIDKTFRFFPPTEIRYAYFQRLTEHATLSRLAPMHVTLAVNA